MDRRVQTIIQRINVNPAHPWTIAGLAKSAGVSASRLNALCHQHLKHGLKRYLIMARLRHASRLLLAREPDGLLSIKTVSERCGFSSQHHFTYQFRKHFKCTPSNYRRKVAFG